MQKYKCDSFSGREKKKGGSQWNLTGGSLSVGFNKNFKIITINMFIQLKKI